MNKQPSQPSPLAVVYTVAQFCAMMQQSRDTFERMVRRGELAAFKIGRRTFIAKEEVERWLRETRKLTQLKVSDADQTIHIRAHTHARGSGRARAAMSGKSRRQAIERTADELHPAE